MAGFCFMVVAVILTLSFMMMIIMHSLHSKRVIIDTTDLIDEISMRGQSISSKRGSRKILYPDRMSEPDAARYPVYTPLLTILERWNPDNPNPPDEFTETLQHFNYSDPYERAMADLFRVQEIPFKLYDVPDIDTVTNKWTNAYLTNRMKGVQPHIEKAKSNHFMFWNIMSYKRQNRKDFVPPTEVVQMSFDEWLRVALRADREEIPKDSDHFYFMINSMATRIGRTFVSEDIPAFSTNKNNFFVTNVYKNKGIQCRFGMRGIIAEAHYDQGKNMVAMIKGSKRYILTPPETCPQLSIIKDKRHPSFRHSVVDWSDMAQAKSHGFSKVNAIDTIVRQGEILYIPSYWFHYITSLSYSIQCNTRSGEPPNGEGKQKLDECMDG